MSTVSGAGGGGGDAFEERARRYAVRKTAVATKQSVEEAQRRAVMRLDKVRPPPPRPTPVSDMEQVLHWLNKHISPDKLARAQREAASALGTASGSGSEMEGMLKGWLKRAKRKSGESAEAGTSAGSPPTGDGGGGSGGGGSGGGGGGFGGLFDKLSGAKGGKAAGAKGTSWLSDLHQALEVEAPAPAEINVWERQRALEVRVQALVERREAERAERRVASQAAKAERRRLRALGGDGFSDSDSDSESDDEAEAKRAAAALSLSQTLRDESVSKFLAQLPILEQQKAEAKKACFAAERALRETLGRKPAEIERRDDEAWGRAAMAFKEADQALFVCKSLCSWDD